MIELLSALGVALLTAVTGPIVRGETDSKLVKRLARHVDIRARLSGNRQAEEYLDELVAMESRVLLKRESRRLNRTVDGGSVAALVFVSLTGGAVVYFLVAWAIALDSRGPGFWLLIFVATAVGSFAAGLSAVGVTTIYKYPSDEDGQVVATTNDAQRSRRRSR